MSVGGNLMWDRDNPTSVDDRQVSVGGDAISDGDGGTWEGGWMTLDGADPMPDGGVETPARGGVGQLWTISGKTRAGAERCVQGSSGGESAWVLGCFTPFKS